MKKQNVKLEGQLLSYTVASGAILAMATPADAGIVYYSNVDLYLSGSTGSPAEGPISIDGEGPLFGFIQENDVYESIGTYRMAGVRPYPPNYGQFIAGGPLPYPYSYAMVAARLEFGATIQANLGGGPNTWTDNSYGLLFVKDIHLTYYGGVTSHSYGNFNQSGYLGIQFDLGEGTLYGWIHIEVAEDLSAITITDWAYNDVVDAPINAGAVPIPSSLALLASGAVGLAALRRRNRKEKDA